MELLQRADFAFRRQRGVPTYVALQHAGQPTRFPPFVLQVPTVFYPWDDNGGVLCFVDPLGSNHTAQPRPLQCEQPAQAHQEGTIGLCRCGVVKYAILFQSNQLFTTAPRYEVAVKIMDKKQLQLQGDDVLNEVHVMAQLQPAGFNGVYNSQHFSQWECSSDGVNEYIATDWAANGSLLMYAQKRLREFKIAGVRQWGPSCSSSSELEPRVNQYVAQMWTLEAIRIFNGVCRGVAYMHAQNVCHLDIDPCNIVLDRTRTPRLIDFGSAEIMSNNGFAGLEDRVIKFKPLYVAREVREHNLTGPPRPGFLGAAADMWSVGVLLYQILCFGYPKGHLALVCDANWQDNLLRHAHQDGDCLGVQSCFVCFRNIRIPPQLYEVLRGVLMESYPDGRMTAFAVCNLIKPLMNVLETTTIRDRDGDWQLEPTHSLDQVFEMLFNC